jgi:peptidyl-prolyl cis-trans isomerase B (cyclophilin B)
MRSVLVVFGIAIIAVVIAIALQKPKGLHPAPQELAYEKQIEESKKAEEEAQKALQQSAAEAAAAFNPNRQGMITAVMSVKGRGDVTIELYPKEAPKTVQKFAALIRDHYFDGMKIHRVEPGFVVQAGDPSQRLQPFPNMDFVEQSIPYEINKLTHEVGTLGVALKAPNTDTGSSQFFINLAANHTLDGRYCVFGKVARGMDVVNKIQVGDIIERIFIQ